MNQADTILVERIRQLMRRRKAFAEQKMFGGVAFMINGNMCVGRWKESLIGRAAREDHDQTQHQPFVKPMDTTDKVMRSWA